MPLEMDSIISEMNIKLNLHSSLVRSLASLAQGNLNSISRGVYVNTLKDLTTDNSDTLPIFTIMTESWEPYSFQKDGIVRGISTDIFVAMMERVGSTQGRKNIQILPWARAYLTIQNTSNTILFTMTKTIEREKKFKWVGPIFEIEYKIYALKKRKIKIDSYEDLKKYKIGTLRSDVVEELLIKKTGLQVDDFERVSQNIMNTKKLFTGRIDLVPQSKDTTLVTCKEAGLNVNDLESVFNLDKKSMYFAFHKDTPDAVIKKFQKAYDDIKEEGKLAKIFKNYRK